MKYCSSCGNKLNSKDVYCSNCGKKIETEVATKDVVVPNNKRLIENRDIAIQLILSLITCGLYSLYWMVTITDDVNKLLDDKNDSGIVNLLLSLVTCGIYLIYWNYDIGKKLKKIGEKYSLDIQDNSIIYMVLSVLKLDVVSYVLMQSDLNKVEK